MTALRCLVCNERVIPDIDSSVIYGGVPTPSHSPLCSDGCFRTFKDSSLVIAEDGRLTLDTTPARVERGILQ